MEWRAREGFEPPCPTGQDAFEEPPLRHSVPSVITTKTTTKTNTNDNDLLAPNAVLSETTSFRRGRDGGQQAKLVCIDLRRRSWWQSLDRARALRGWHLCES